MNLLVVIPTRSRGQKFLTVLQKYVDTITNKDSVHFLLTYDDDDPSMSYGVIDAAKNITEGRITAVKGKSESKIHACNRDLPNYEGEWDVVLLASDDMIPQIEGWDVIIAKAMSKFFPDTDGCLWFNDGHQDRVCTFTIMGRAYYERQGYLYHPEYKSLWCDNEHTEVATNAGKMQKFGHVLFFHDHPIWTQKRSELDRQYQVQSSRDAFNRDRKVFERRKANNFA